MARRQILICMLIMLLFGTLTGCIQSSNHIADTPNDIFDVRIALEDQDQVSQQVITEIMPVLEAFFWGTVEDRRSLVQFLTTGCTTADGLGGPPKCAPGEVQGTLVEVFPIAGVEGHFVRPEEIDRTLEFNVKGLYAVYRPTPGVDAEEYWPTGEYVLLFEREMLNASLPITFYIQDGKLVRLGFSHPVDPAELLNEIPLDQILLTPDEAKELTEQVTSPR